MDQPGNEGPVCLAVVHQMNRIDLVWTVPVDPVHPVHGSDRFGPLRARMLAGWFFERTDAVQV